MKKRAARSTALVSDDEDRSSEDSFADGCDASNAGYEAPPDTPLPPKASYELIDHPADVGVLAVGATIGDAVAAAGLGMFSVMTDLATVAPKRFFKLRYPPSAGEGAKHPRLPSERLVYELLNEFLYLYGRDYTVCSAIRVEPVGDAEFELRCWGERFERARHPAGTEVKAVTLHGLSVEASGDGVRVKVLLDI